MRWTPRFAGLTVVLLVGPGLAPARAAETHDSAKTNSPVADCYQHAKQRPVGFERVTIGPGFLQEVRDRSREVGTPDYLEKFEQAHYIDFFRWVHADPPRRRQAGPNNDEFVHKLLAIMLGPMAYCVGAPDNPGVALRHLSVSKDIAPRSL
jgi:hypothetical protein